MVMTIQPSNILNATELITVFLFLFVLGIRFRALCVLGRGFPQSYIPSPSEPSTSLIDWMWYHMLWEAEQEDPEFEDSLSNIARPQ